MRLVNFNAGPAALPHEVLVTIRDQLLDWQHTGISILETGHRTGKFSELGEKLEASVRRILSVPDDFAVLFLPGGGQVQFAIAAMNLSRGFTVANYIETGHWSAQALQEGKKYIDAHLAASSKAEDFCTIPPVNSWDLKPNAAYIHYCANETIGGIEFPVMPYVDHAVMVSDMSSNIFTRPVDFSRIGCLYACAQKNLGVAGMSLVIVRRDLLDRAKPETPTVFNYATQEKNKSLACTPTTFSWYVASLVLDWLEHNGGLKQMTANSIQKSSMLYEFIDSSDLYINNIEPQYRSRANVVFKLRDQSLEAQFLSAAKDQGLINLAGHRTVGGMRASIYNAISVDDVARLVDFMRHFKNQG